MINTLQHEIIRHGFSQNLLFWTSGTDLLVVLLLGLEAVVRGLEPQVDMREIVQPVSPPGRDVIHPSRRHPCPEPKKFRLQPKLASPPPSTRSKAARRVF